MTQLRRAGVAVAVAGLLAVAGCSSSGSTHTGAAPTNRGATTGSRWVSVIDNPWFPLKTGMRWVYRGFDNNQPVRDVMTVTNQTRVVAGVTTTVVHDDLYSRAGRPLEVTSDWYAQDAAGNVWYFGEATAELDRAGHVKTREGSWESGVHGARPGVIMYADPTVGRSYAQEHLAGHAEDHAQVLSLASPVHVPAAQTSAALETKEWSPLEPKVLEHKWYVRGIGDVYENTVRGGREFIKLVSFHPAP